MTDQLKQSLNKLDRECKVDTQAARYVAVAHYRTLSIS